MIVPLNVNRHAKHTKILSKSALKSSHQDDCDQIKSSVALTIEMVEVEVEVERDNTRESAEITRYRFLRYVLPYTSTSPYSTIYSG